ncbi:MAG: ABC transporter permease [Propioniciclava sp.]
MNSKMAQLTHTNAFRNYGGTLLALLVLVLLFSFTNQYFFTARNIQNVLVQMAIIAILAFGMTYVLMLGQIDLSVGSIIAVSGIMLGWGLQTGVRPLVAVILSLLVGVCCGTLNGLISSYMRIPTFIVTVATMGIFRGGGYAVTGAAPISINDPVIEWFGNGRVAGVPVPIIIMIVMLVVMHVTLTRTKFGRQIVLTGGNVEAARFAGIRVEKLQLYVFMIMGGAAAVSALIMTSRLYSAQPNAALGYELDAIAAAVLGGTSLTGGRGTVMGTFIGALIIAVVNNGMNLLGIEYYFQTIVKGLIIIAAVYIDVRSKKQRLTK